MTRGSNVAVADVAFEPSFGPRGALRQKVGSTGRIHLDRWLPFLVLHRSSDPESSIARKVAVNSPAYLIWSPHDDDEAKAVLDAIVPELRERLGSLLFIELNDASWRAAQEDSPRLTPFIVTVGACGGEGADAASEALAQALGNVEVDLRRPEVCRASPSDPLCDAQRAGDRLTLTVSQIHRAPDGQLYPQLTHELTVALVDCLLRAAAVYMSETGPQPPVHYRSLGRSAVLAGAKHADKQLDTIARSFDFLLSLTPINTSEAMQRFIEDGEEKQPEFRYRPLAVDPDLVKRDLYAIDLTRLEDPLLERLLCEKRWEIDHQLTMLATRNSPAFRPASMLLYGAVSPQLLSDAHAILASVREPSRRRGTIDASQVAAAAGRLVDRYRSVDERFAARIEVRDDVAGLLVSAGRLLVSSSTSMAQNRLDALLSHEVSVHLLTYFNGSTQGLAMFRTGLARYEGIQEGLGVFAEWAVGGLTSARLRLLAGRVVAVEAMIGGASFIDVYRRLNRDLGFSRKSAFDVSMRVFRSGGFAKDAIYLKGFREVVDRVATGATLDAFWLGKIAPDHVDAVEELLLRGLLQPPVFIPEFLERADARERIGRLRSGLPFDKLLELE